MFYSFHSPIRKSLSRAASSFAFTSGFMTLAGRVSALWGKYLHSLAQRPIRVKMATAASIVFLSDCNAQWQQQRRTTQHNTSYELERSLRMAAWYGVPHVLYIHHFFQLLDRLFGPSLAIRTALLKTAFDQLVNPPILVSSFLLFDRLVATRGDVLAATTRVKQDALMGIKLAWSIWTPALVINILFVPLQLRVLYVNCVSFGFTTLLSSRVNSS
jgi:hypothetical protein